MFVASVSANGPNLAGVKDTSELVRNTPFIDATLREAACGRRLWSLGIDVPCGHRCGARRGVAKRQERVGYDEVRRVLWEA